MLRSRTLNQLICCIIAAATVLTLSGCATIQRGPEAQKEEPPDPVTVHLSAADALLAQGDFEGSLKENQKALSLAGKESPGDRALYNMGLIYIHYKNPRKNYEKARAQFEMIVREYPDSTLAEEAKIWNGVLQVIEKLKQVDIDIEEKKKELAR